MMMSDQFYITLTPQRRLLYLYTASFFVKTIDGIDNFSDAILAAVTQLDV
jgi:hypothetical protein